MFKEQQSPASVVVVSRPGVMQRALLTSLAVFPWINVIGCAGDGLNALSRIAACQPDLVVIDANLLDHEVEALLAAIKTVQHPPRCLVLRYTCKDIGRLLAAGANACILHECSTQEFADILLKVAQIQRN